MVTVSEGFAILVNDLEIAKQFARWGTYGKSGQEKLRWVRLVDCSTEHLEAILRTQRGVYHSDYGLIIRSILEDRGARRRS